MFYIFKWRKTVVLIIVIKTILIYRFKHILKNVVILINRKVNGRGDYVIAYCIRIFLIKFRVASLCNQPPFRIRLWFRVSSRTYRLAMFMQSSYATDCWGYVGIHGVQTGTASSTIVKIVSHQLYHFVNAGGSRARQTTF